MPDDIDRAQDQEAMIRALELRAAAHRRSSQPAQLVSDLGMVYCLDCGERIPAERLAAVPGAAFCVACQAERED